MRLDPAQGSGYGRSVDAKVNGDTVGIHPQQVQVCGLRGDFLVSRRLREFGKGHLEGHPPPVRILCDRVHQVGIQGSP